MDYPYMLAGKKLPDRHPVLLGAHLAAVDGLARRPGQPLILVGKSMGGRIACHVACERNVDAVICMGYPLRSPSGKMRDEVLRQLSAPVLYVQGTRDKLCPLDLLEKTRQQLETANRLHTVESGDHSLLATKTWLKKNKRSQDDIDTDICASIKAFVNSVQHSKG